MFESIQRKKPWRNTLTAVRLKKPRLEKAESETAERKNTTAGRSNSFSVEPPLVIHRPPVGEYDVREHRILQTLDEFVSTREGGEGG